ncbi:BMC domain-containing protein [Vibrio sp. 10N.222.51.C12]|uniref:BMC domain-containing protein n=1 Tax=unclassified Vibrio TaxID=2614977 RepID=UPI000C843991|nr:BMC domain-containing protein [Vibrio sp. 10N.286.48.B7]PMH81209.1 hypothetical protein BCU58_02970 [Vibrio sp. 10N.286.48.B7]
MKVSLGLIEVKGFALAIMVADNMAKCAAIEVVDVENTNGSGWMLIKIIGDVASVQAAIQSGSGFAQNMEGLVSYSVLSNPDSQLIKQALDLAGKTQSNSAPLSSESTSIQEESTEGQSLEVQGIAAPSSTDESISKIDILNECDIEDKSVNTFEDPVEATCNICQDPVCPRKKGDPRIDCIHGGSLS